MNFREISLLLSKSLWYTLSRKIRFCTRFYTIVSSSISFQKEVRFSPRKDNTVPDCQTKTTHVLFDNEAREIDNYTVLESRDRSNRNLGSPFHSHFISTSHWIDMFFVIRICYENGSHQFFYSKNSYVLL